MKELLWGLGVGRVETSDIKKETEYSGLGTPLGYGRLGFISLSKLGRLGSDINPGSQVSAIPTSLLVILGLRLSFNQKFDGGSQVSSNQTCPSKQL